MRAAVDSDRLTAPAAPPSGDDIPIDVDLIKVLASDTRRDILRLLGGRRRTLSELAEALGLKKATILEHLEKLTAADLVRRIDDGERIWIYYELTRRGDRLVHPQRTTRFYLIMAGSVVAVVLLGAIVAAMLASNAGEDSAAPGPYAPDLVAERSELADDLRAATPLVVYRGFDDGVTILLDAAAPPEARLVVGGHEIPVSGDRAVLAAREIDALPEGRYALSLRTGAGDLPLRSELDVRTPPVSLAPLAVPEHATSRLVVSVGAPGLPPPADLVVLVEGEPVALTRGGHEAYFALTPRGDDVIDVRIGRLIQREVRVLPDVALAASDDNGTLVLEARVAGAPLEGARVRLGLDELGVTDANGTLRVAWPAEGEHALRIDAPDGRASERAVRVGGGALTEVPPLLQLAAYSDPSARTLDAQVEVTNLGQANETITLVARLDGTAIASARLDVAAGARAETRLAASVPLNAPVTIEAYGARTLLVAWAPRALVADEDGDAGASPMAAAEPGNATLDAGSQTASRATPSKLAGRAPDATYTLFPAFAAPTFAPGEAPGDQAPAVPGPGAALVVLAAIAAALMLARRRR